MRRKASVLRLSPNEEAQLVREELESRRKLRLKQVREQERYIARQVRRQVQERRQQQMQMLTDALQLEWQQQHRLKLQALSSLYQHSLASVGLGHRSARQNEPDLEALAQKSVERQERAEERHREALRELGARRHEEQQQRCRPIEARRKALEEEKQRAVRVASLPPPPPNPVESIGKMTPRPLKSVSEHFSVTHCHMPQTAVDRETHPQQQLSAHQAAALEVQRVEELRRGEARERQEQLEKARLRGNHALRREQHTQDGVRMLCELERLQQADLLRRRQELNSVPAQIFQPLYRQEELRREQQRELEIAFEDLNTQQQQQQQRSDVVLQLVPEPLPPLSAASHDEELDVTLDPECAPEGEEPDIPTETTDPGRRALRRLLDRIRSQRDRQRAALTSQEGEADVEASSVETGSLSSQEKAPEASLDEQTPSLTHTDDGPDVSDEAVVAGTLRPPEEQDQLKPASERRATHEEALLRQQQEQLAVLEELEQKRRELEQRLRETQHMNKTLQDAAQRRPVIQESSGLPEVDSDDPHTQRLHQYQQRLLEQNRLHKKSVEEARRRLQEYQHTLKMRHAFSSTTAARAALQQPSESSETHSALPLLFNPDACALHLGEEPAGQPPARPVLPQQALHSPPKPAGSDASRPSVLSEGPPLEASAGDGQQGRVPLPPPAVVLELLRSRLHQADIPGPAAAPSPGPAGPVQREAETDGPEVLRRHMRRQRDALQALITADLQASVSISSASQADQMALNTLLNAIEEANSHTRRPTAPIQQDGATPALSNDGVYDPAPVTRGRAKPPVSRPPARLAFLQQMEQHELSAIQEVDTPVNISLDTELQSSADVSESSSASLPALTPIGSHSPSERSQVTGRISRMSWREMLQLDSTASPGPSSMKLQQERFSAGRPSSVDPDYLSSTTISTGSYFTSEPDDSHLCIEPDVCGPSPDDRESSASVQQIIDKYSHELSASLTRAGAAANTRSAGQSWSGVLHEEVQGDTSLSSTNISGAFLPLQPHQDVDSSSSSSSSRSVVRDDQSSTAQGWSETVNRILDRLSNQLSIRQGEQAHGRAPSRLSSSPCTDQDRASDSSHFTNQSLQSSPMRMSGAGHSSSCSDSVQLQDQSSSGERFDGSVLIGRASDMGSSQVFDQSRALADAPQEVTPGTGPGRPAEVPMSPALQHSDEDRSASTDAPHDDASDWFLPLPSDVTNNESVDQSAALCIPLEADRCGTDVDEASDWLESTDQSLQHLRADTLTRSHADLQISMERLSLTHESLCETDVGAAPALMDDSHMPRSPPKTRLQEESLTAQFPSQEVRSAVEENALSELLERAQAAGDFVKGILEESTISFISLPESTLQDPDLAEDSEPQEDQSDRTEGKAPSRTVEDDEEPSFPHAVMLLEFQCSPAQRQRRDGLAQRSALRAAQVKARRTTPQQHVSRAAGHTALKPDTAERLKSVAEVRICSAAQRRVEEAEMHRRTERLYSQLEEVKQQKEFRSRRESYAKNREKARDFQRKTLEKLRAKLKP